MAESKHHTAQPFPQMMAIEKRGRKRKSLKWLKYLFLATLFLLIFQVLLGWAARAITLLTDCAHSAADVVSYGLSFLAEWSKTAQLPFGHRRCLVFSDEAGAAKLIDSGIAIISLITLLVATGFGLAEAFESLNDATQDSETSANIGRALLAFAIVSTSVNVGLLVLYQRSRTTPTTTTRTTPTTTKKRSGDADPESTPEVSVPVPEVFCNPQDDGVDTAPTTPQLSTSSLDFTSAMDHGTFGKKFKFCPPCNAVPATPPDVASDAAPTTASASAPATAPIVTSSGEVLSKMHMVMHIGCTCALDVGDEDGWEIAEGSFNALEDGSTIQASATKAKNLNMAAAMIHLAADFLRGIVILVLACLIQLDVLQDSQQADAYCAIGVAGLISVGSLVLLLRAMAVIAKLAICLRGIIYTPMLDDA